MSVATGEEQERGEMGGASGDADSGTHEVTGR
jgi:hypothetical protein